MKLFLQIQYQRNLDLFTFYTTKSSVSIPEEHWFQAISASLRMKHSVLILETENMLFPVVDESKRWVATDHYLWLSPRSLSVISAAYLNKAMNFHEFKSFLTTSK